MEQTVSAGATLFTTAHPDVVKRTSILSVVVSALCCIIGAGAFVASFKTDDSSSTLAMALMVGGTILFLVAVFRLFWRSKEWVYLPTGSVAKEGCCYFDVCDLQMLEDVLKKKNFEIKNGIQMKANGNVRMDYMLAKDKQFVAVQLFRFIPYTYEPASSLFYYTGEESEAFVRRIETNEF